MIASLAEETFLAKQLLAPAPVGPERTAKPAPPVSNGENDKRRPPGESGEPPAAKDMDPVDEEVFVFPATAAQRRFWLVDQLVPGGNSALNMPLAIRLRGQLDRPALERAFDAILSRHEILRTTFQYEKGQLCQVIVPAMTLPVPLVDVRDFPEAERARVPDHLIDEEAQRPFDLAHGPVCRARLVRVGLEDHLLLFTLHHIICDGWSNGLLLRELAALYGAFSEGKPSPLAELPLQFADFAQWQADRSAEGGFDAQMAYWRERLAGSLPVLDLPTDRPRRAASRGRAAAGDIRWQLLPAELTASLKALAVREGVSAYMLYLSAFTVLLSRYGGGGEDVLVSTPSANRARTEVENLVGLFVNPLLLRADLSGDPTFGELLSRMRKVVLGAFEHADAPFERLIEEIQPRRLQVNFLYQGAFLQPIRLPGLEMLPLRSVSGGALFEWTGAAIEDADGVRLCIEYNADLFDAATIDHVLGDYEALLESVAVAGGTQTTIWRLPLASAAVSGAPGQRTALLAQRWQMPPESAGWAERFLDLAKPGGDAGELGRTRPYVALRVVDRHGQDAPAGVPGEIRVNSGGLPESDFRTGDLGLRRADGGVEWLGRIDAQEQTGGLRLDARRIESALCAHPHIRQALVRLDGSPRRLTAYFLSDDVPAALVSPAQLRAFLKERLPEEWLPAAFVGLEQLPVTTAGWLDAARLPAPADVSPAEHEPNYDAPYLTLHHQIIDIWQEIFAVPRIGIRDDFFTLGGNSLLAMRMLYRVEQACGKALLPATLFQRPTVEGLADAILHDAEGGPPPELLAIQENGSKTPIFYFHGDMTGGGFYCKKLSRALGTEQPFYALPPLDVSDGRERPSIETMATEHLRAIRDVRPHGPYVLGGFCLGGLVAHAVARQMEAQGEQVERLLIIDATARNRRLKLLRRFTEWLGRWRHWNADQQLYHFCQWHYLLARLRRWRGLPLAKRASILRRQVANRLRGLVGRFRPAAEETVQEMPPSDAEEGIAPGGASGSTLVGGWFDPRWDVPLVFLWATGGYEVKPVAGPTTLLLSHDLLGSEADEPVEREWSRYLPRLDTRALAGSHLACITEHVDGLAETIRESLAVGH